MLSLCDKKKKQGGPAAANAKRKGSPQFVEKKVRPHQTSDNGDNGPLTDRDFEIIDRLVPQDQIQGKIVASALHWFED